MSHARAELAHFTGSTRPMGPGDFIWLAALGATARAPATAETVCGCVDTVAAGQWAPSAQLICDCLDEMVRARHLDCTTIGHMGLFSITEQGRGILSMMLALPIERPTTPLGQVGLRLKLAFLDLADPLDRALHLAELIAVHRRELAGFADPCGDCTAPGCFGRMWNDHRAEALRRDLDLLQRMQDLNGGYTLSQT